MSSTTPTPKIAENHRTHRGQPGPHKQRQAREFRRTGLTELGSWSLPFDPSPLKIKTHLSYLVGDLARFLRRHYKFCYCQYCLKIPAFWLPFSCWSNPTPCAPGWSQILLLPKQNCAPLWISSPAGPWHGSASRRICAPYPGLRSAFPIHRRHLLQGWSARWTCCQHVSASWLTAIRLHSPAWWAKRHFVGPSQ